jgi:hypothetical protein
VIKGLSLVSTHVNVSTEKNQQLQRCNGPETANTITVMSQKIEITAACFHGIQKYC